jgi:superfamily II DNA/RNA helicase
MPFKKLNTPLKDVLEHLGIEDATAFQKKAIPKIKSGTDLFVIGEDGCGKTTTLIINTLQKLKSQPDGDNPRALIFVKDKKSALALEEEFKRFTQQMDLRIYSVYEEQNREKQRDAIYLGMDIVIGTQKRLHKLYHLNGLNLGDLKILAIADANLLPQESFATEIIRITESLPRCQFLVFSNTYNKKLETLRNSFMENAQLVEA